MNSAPLRTALTAAIAGLIASAALAQDSRWGPLAPALETLDMPDDWTVTLDTEALTIVNTQNNDARSMIYEVPTYDLLDPETFGRRTISTTVEIAVDGGASHAGIAYWYGNDYYYMFTLSRDREGERRVTLWAVQDGTNQRLTTLPYAESIVELGIREDGSKIHLLVNGEDVALLQGATGMGRGLPGLVVWGIGTYVFTSYSNVVAAQ